MTHIAIIGHGIEGWLTAARLAHALPPDSASITVVPAAHADVWDALYAVQPLEPNDTLRAVGLSDLSLVQNCAASFGLGSVWQDDRVIPYGASGNNLGGVAFHHHWRRLNIGTTPADYFRFSPGARALARNVFAPPVPHNAIGSLQHEIARHVEPTALRDLLRTTALDLGVTQTAAPLAAQQGFEPDSVIDTVLLTSGKVHRAELFIDASGPHQALCKKRPVEQWSRHASLSWQVESSRHPRTQTLRPAFSVHHNATQWRIDVPLHSDDLRLNFTPASANTSAPFSTGFSMQPWQHNVVALGHTAARSLPLAGLQSRLLNQSLVRLIKLLPSGGDMRAVACEFNQLFARDAEQVRDLTHWLRDGHLDHASARFVSRHKLFAKRGWVMPSDGAVVTADDWINAFIGRGLLPQTADPLSRRLPESEVDQMVTQLEHDIERVVGEFPALDHYLQVARSTPPRQRTGAPA
ncbi:MAG: tryptophan 7-halogenase [Gammaproteobacteria bacterium]